MKIANSNIAMASTHEAVSYSYKESMTMEAAASKDAAGAILTLSKEANASSYMESMQQYQKRQESELSKHNNSDINRLLEDMARKLKAQNVNQFRAPDETDLKIKMLRRILANLRGEKPEDDFEDCKNTGKVKSTQTEAFKKFEGMSIDLSSAQSLSLGVIANRNPGSGSGTLWQKVTATSGFSCEMESTTFASTGTVKTADGRSIDFNVEVSMTRAFMEKIDILESQEYIKTDPLIINLDTNVTSVSDQKFLFDLDADGKEEYISFAGSGSGFLALDINQDGKINDGSELFGTKSGDGFKDLAKFDEDGNGWIDENDKVFSMLKIWTKDANGKDSLIDLKKADVGAIYLGSADTQFSLKNSENRLNAEVKKTGIYLRESNGLVGTLNHVDLVI